MTTPYSKYYLNSYLRQADILATDISWLNDQYGYSSEYSTGAIVGSTVTQFASIFLTCWAANKFNNYEQGGGGGAAKTELETKIEKQLDILGPEYDVNNYTDASIEKETQYQEAIDLANENIETTNRQISTLDSEISTLDADLTKAESTLQGLKEDDQGYLTAKRKVEELAAELEAKRKKKQALEATIEEGGTLAKAKADAVKAQSLRKQKIDAAKKQLDILVEQLKQAQSTSGDMNASLDKADGNWLKRIGDGDNATAMKAIRKFRKAKLDYDALSDGAIKNSKKDELIKLANAAIICNKEGLDGSVVAGLSLIQNWLDEANKTTIKKEQGQ